MTKVRFHILVKKLDFELPESTNVLIFKSISIDGKSPSLKCILPLIILLFLLIVENELDRI